MKSFLLPLAVFMAILPTSLVAQTQAQQVAIDGILKNSLYTETISSFKQDATTLYQGYAGVATKSIGYMMNTGWFSTARAKGKFPRFSFYLTSSIVNIPSRENTFYLKSDDLKYLELTGLEKSQDIATIFGSTVDAPVFRAKGVLAEQGNNPEQIIFVSSGASTNYLPIVYFQGSVGIIKGTDILLRASIPLSVATPSVNLQSDLMWGVGLKHSISQWIGGNEDRKTPIDVSVQVGYSQYGVKAKNKTIIPQGLNDANTLFAQEGKSMNYDEYVAMLKNQETKLKFAAINANVIGSVQLAFFTPFVSVGYSIVSATQSVIGNYPIVLGQPTHSLPIPDASGKYVVSWITDPITLNSSYTTIHFTLGARIKFGPFAARFAYHNIDFSVYEIGVGIDI